MSNRVLAVNSDLGGPGHIRQSERDPGIIRNINISVSSDGHALILCDLAEQRFRLNPTLAN